MVTKNRTIILIGGAPTTGKSTVAEAVAKHLGLPWLSTDQIRGIMRTVADRKQVPKLFNPEGYDAERFLKEFSAQQIAAMEMEQGEAVWPAVKTFINEDYTWEKGFVLEGVNILPKLIRQDFLSDNEIKPIFLVDEDADRIRKVVFTRGLWDDADAYPNEVKEKEVEWVLAFSHLLKKQAEEYGYPTVEVNKDSNDSTRVLQKLGI